MARGIAELPERTATSNESRYGLRKRLTVAAAMAGTMLAAAGCPSGEPEPLPGERLAVVRYDTDPPEQIIKIIGEVTAGPPALVEQFGRPEKTDPAPQEFSVSYEPGHETQMYTEGSLTQAPPLGEDVELSCQVFADGVEIPGTGDSVQINAVNWDDPEFGIAVCVFNESLVPGN